MIKNIIFDFDGVILESNDVKIEGFFKLFEEYGEEKALFISNYFKGNAGLSRYDIIKYFFSKFYNENISEEKLIKYANQYSNIVKEKVVNTRFVEGYQDFILNKNNYELFIVSSSDEKDLKYICDKINITNDFNDILGSPIKKAINIENVIIKYNLKKNETLYIGDSINDYHATIKNDLAFIGRNSGVYDFNKIDNILVIENLKDLNKKIKELKC